MKNKIALFGEEVLSGMLYDENKASLEYKSGSFFNKLSLKYEVWNYSRKSMTSDMALEYLTKLISFGYTYEFVIVNIGCNEAKSGVSPNKFERNLIRIIDLCKKNSMKMILVGLACENNPAYDAYNEVIMCQSLFNGIKYVSNSDMYCGEAYTLVGQENLANNLFVLL